MNKTEILNKYSKQEDKLLISKVLDKIKYTESRNKIEITDFLDLYQIRIIKDVLNRIKFKNYILFGGFEESERKVLCIYPDKFNEDIVKKNIFKEIKVIRIILPKEMYGKYFHRNYLGAIIKLGIEREKVRRYYCRRKWSRYNFKKRYIRLYI